jgi:hypothetical protein
MARPVAPSVLIAAHDALPSTSRLHRVRGLEDSEPRLRVHFDTAAQIETAHTVRGRHRDALIRLRWLSGGREYMLTVLGILGC